MFRASILFFPPFILLLYNLMSHSLMLLLKIIQCLTYIASRHDRFYHFLIPFPALKEINKECAYCIFEREKWE